MYGRWKRSQYLMGFTKIDFLFFVKKPLNVFSILFIILVHTHRYSREWFEYDSCASCFWHPHVMCLGSATVEREGLSATLVRDIRNYFQISPEYFSMLLVGKDGNVKSWYPSPMWSMAIIYDLIDSMQLRRQEMAIQQSLGMRCPEDEYGGYGYHHGYHEGYQEGYHQGYGY